MILFYIRYYLSVLTMRATTEISMTELVPRGDLKVVVEYFLELKTKSSRLWVCLGTCDVEPVPLSCTGTWVYDPCVVSDPFSPLILISRTVVQLLWLWFLLIFLFRYVFVERCSLPFLPFPCFLYLFSEVNGSKRTVSSPTKVPLPLSHLITLEIMASSHTNNDHWCSVFRTFVLYVTLRRGSKKKGRGQS